MGVLAYDPARVAVLYERALAVSAHLAAGRCRDPAAAAAVATSDTVRAHLDERWLPALRSVMASDALLTWRAAAPAGLPPGDWFDEFRPLHGQALGDALAERAADLHLDRFDEMRRALGASAGDDAAMRAFVTELGAPGLVALEAQLLGAAPATGAEDLAPVVRAVFVAAAPDLPAAFGDELVRAAASARRERPSSPLAGAALGYLLAGGQLPSELLVSAIASLRTVEREHRFGARLWEQWAPPIVNPDLVEDLRPQHRGIGATYGLDEVYDPAYALLRQLAADGDAGREIFGRHDVARSFFVDRPITADGGRAVTAAAAAAATDGIDAGADPATIRGAMVVASEFVNGFGGAHADDLLAHPDDDVSTAAAAILGRHLQSVQVTVAPGAGAADGNEPTGVVTSQLEALGPDGPRRRAQFDPAALAATIDLAVNTAEGVTATRDWLTTYQASVAGTAVRRLAAGEIARDQMGTFLDEAMQDAGRLEGVFASHVGHRAEARGRDKDRELTFWVQGLGAAVRVTAGAAAGPYTSAVLGQAIDPVADGFAARLAHHQADAAAGAERWAQDATDRLLYLWDRELCNQGVVVPELPAALLAGGGLPAFDGLEARLATVRADDPDPDRRTYDLRAVLNAIDVAVGPSGVAVDDGALYDAVKAAQLDIYQQLD
jgi:hypothetical protein